MSRLGAWAAADIDRNQQVDAADQMVKRQGLTAPPSTKRCPPCRTGLTRPGIASSPRRRAAAMREQRRIAPAQALEFRSLCLGLASLKA